MLRDKINTYLFLIIGISFTSLGIICLTEVTLTINNIIKTIGVFLIILGMLTLIFNILKKEFISIIRSILNIIFGLICVNYSNVLIIIIARLFGIYILFISLTHLVNYVIYFSNKIKGKLYIIIKFIITFILSIILLFKTTISIKYLSIILGIYLILFGINNITNFITEILSTKYKIKIKRSINIQLPILLTAFIPQKLISLINELIQTDNYEKLNIKKNDKENNLQVLIHLAKNGTATLGHVEVAFNDKVYSYGNYDMHSRTLFNSIGDGVILIANKKKYIDYCINKRDRIIVEFGISLNDKEKELVKERINSLINTNTIDYHTDLELNNENKEYTDMSSEIYKYASGKYKKIIKGKYKKFFVLKTNCVMIVQYILSSVGKEVLAINGILSPGAYYEYLNKRFNMKNTNVISRKIYSKKKSI